MLACETTKQKFDSVDDEERKSRIVNWRCRYLLVAASAGGADAGREAGAARVS